MDLATRPDGRPWRIAFWTLGCRLNQYDTESMKARLPADGAVLIVPWQDEADVYVLNSCTVTGKADQECRRLARQIKRQHPDARVVVTGCYAQTQPDALAAVPEIDGVIGNTAKDDIGGWLPELLAHKSGLRRVSPFASGPAFAAPVVGDFEGRSRAFVKVQDGCNLRCSYCLIRSARGPARSRPVPDVLRQLAALAERGFPEVVLAGIHLGAYGRDLAPRASLPQLLEAVLRAEPALRVRLSSIHPNEVTPRLLALMAAEPRLRPHLHISLQSGSDDVLGRMRRPYRREEAIASLERAARELPHLGLGADLIVGFPGETDDAFARTREMVEALPFSYLHVFRFSPRPGTPAADLPDRVHPETVTARSRELRALAERKKRAFARAQRGAWREAVVEAESAADGLRQATLDNYAGALVPAGLEAGTLVRLRGDVLRGDRILAAEIEPVSGVRQPPVARRYPA